MGVIQFNNMFILPPRKSSVAQIHSVVELPTLYYLFQTPNKIYCIFPIPNP